MNVVRQLPRPTTVNSSIAVITPNKGLDGVYLYFLFAINFQRKLKTGLYTVISENVEVWEQAKQLSIAHSPALGARSLDIWHVAFAIVQDAKAFGSFDEHQRRLASEAGLALNAV